MILINNIYILGYLYFWGTIYIIITTLLALFKSEKSNSTVKDVQIVQNKFGIIKTYNLIFKIIKLPHIKRLAIILLTVKVRIICIQYTKIKLI